MMIYFDEDSDARFFQPEAGTMTSKDLDDILQSIGQTAIGVYIVGVNAQMVNYPSSVMESYLDHFQMDDGLFQLEYTVPLSAWGYRRRANMKVLERQGIDSNRYLLDGVRRQGREGWIGIRMNDMHDGHDECSPIHSRLWREQQNLRIPGNIPCGNGFDYSLEQVRNLYVDLAEEAFQRYHPDNLLLDWMRWPAFFPKGSGRQNAPLITEMLKELRRRIGQPFACRVPLTPETALNLGLDVQEWHGEGLLSHLFIGNFFCAGEFDAPVETWRSMVGKLPVIVSLEQGGWSDGLHEKPQTSSPAEMRAMAAAAYWRGADGVHPFNCMPYLNNELPEAVRKEKIELLNSLDSPEMLYVLPRRHHLGWDDSTVHIGDLDQISRVPGYFEEWLKTHERPANSLPLRRPAGIVLHTAKAPEKDAVLYTDAEGVKVNGHVLQGLPPYRIPVGLLKDGVTEIETASEIHQLYLDFN